MPLSLSADATIRDALPAARAGDADAYGRIVAACQNTITAVALAITRDVQASEDVAQEAFLSAWQHLDRLHNPDSFLPWVRQIARNLARDHLRRLGERPLDGPNAELAMAMAADPGPQPMHRVLDEEREAAAAELIAALPEDSREALVLFYREGQSSQQVALLLGITDAAVRKRLSRARQQVRDDLLRRFGDFARDSAPGAAFTTVVVGGLGIATKPASAAAAVVGGTAGAGIAGKALALLGGGSGMIAGTLGGSVIAGALAAHLTRTHLLAYAETREERADILRRYWIYMAVTVPLVALGFVATLLAPSFAIGMAFAVFVEVASLVTLLQIHRTLRPLIARDRARDPEGAKRRYRAYDYTYGPTAIVVSGIFYLCAMAMFNAAVHWLHGGSLP
jgi:RNA polymerase sigma factor (sigma-70 family)